MMSFRSSVAAFLSTMVLASSSLASTGADRSAAYRDAVLGRPIDWGGLSISFIVTFLVLALGIREFRRMDRKFADLI